MIMDEIRKRPQCRNIKGVAIIRPLQQASHHPNWDVAWTVDGAANAVLLTTEIAQKFRNEFDLARA
jgi:hypothetical protein